MEVFFLKIMDCALSTIKSVFLYKNKNFLSSIFNALSTFFYMSMIVKMTKANDSLTIFIICLATFIGSYLPTFLLDKLEKDKVYIFVVTPDTNENGKEFADMIRENNIPIFTFKGYNENLEQVLCCKIFSESKKQSTLIENMIPEGFKYHVLETKNVVLHN
jgi:hypothetical protein